MSDFVECPRCKAELIIQDGKDMEKAISHLRTELEELIAEVQQDDADGVDGVEPVAWRCEKCWHVVHTQERPHLCYGCGGAKGRLAEWEPLYGPEQVEQEIEDARVLHCRRVRKGKPLCRTANEGSFQEIRCHVCAALNYLKDEVDGQ